MLAVNDGVCLANNVLSMMIRAVVDARLTAQIHVSQDPLNGHIAFVNGDLVAATLGRTSDIAALELILLTMPKGPCFLRSGSQEVLHESQASTASVKRRSDYGSRHRSDTLITLLALIGRPHTIQPDIDGDSAADIVISRATLLTFLMIPSHQTIQQVCREHGLARGLRDLITLLDLGLIRIWSQANAHAYAGKVVPPSDRDALATPAEHPNVVTTDVVITGGAPHQLAIPHFTSEPAGSGAVTPVAVNAELPQPPRRKRLLQPRRPSLRRAAARLAVLAAAAVVVIGCAQFALSLGDSPPRPEMSDPIVAERPRDGLSSAAQALRTEATGTMPSIRQAPTLTTGAAVPGASPGAAPAVNPNTAGSASAQSVSAPPGRGLRAILHERFGSNTVGWPSDPAGTGWLGERGYQLVARNPGQFVAIGVPQTESLRDVVVTGRFRKTGGPPGGGYGLIVRDEGPGPRDGRNQRGRFYVLEVGDRGEIGIWRRENDTWVDIIPWTAFQAVRPGSEPNELVALAISNRLAFSINGVSIASVVDETLTAGSVGIFVGGDLNEVALEELIVEVPNY
jgi:hypothetical protein